MGDLLPTVIILVVVGISLALGATILGNMKPDGTAGQLFYDCNATGQLCKSYTNDTIDDSIDGLTELASWQDTVAIVVAAAIILGLLTLFYRGRV